MLTRPEPSLSPSLSVAACGGAWAGFGAAGGGAAFGGWYAAAIDTDDIELIACLSDVVVGNIGTLFAAD